jgi:hypothetical protein
MNKFTPRIKEGLSVCACDPHYLLLRDVE